MIALLAPFAVAVAGVGLLAIFSETYPQAQTVAVPTFLGLAVSTALAGLALPRLADRLRSVRTEGLLVALTAMTTAIVAITISSVAMILDPSEVRLILILAVVGATLGIVLEYTVSRRLARDLRRIRATARRVGAGDLTARAELGRNDEVGEAARAIDALASSLMAMESERAQAQRARQSFLAAVGHDLRTPLAALRAATEALEDGLVPDPPRYFAAIRADLDAMSTLVADLYLLARIEAGGLEFQRVAADLAELIDEAVEALTPLARSKRVSIRVVTPGQVIAPVGPAEFSRIARNLLDNAIRHTDPDSEVSIELSRSGEQAIVRVVDQGHGFPDELQGLLSDAPSRTTGTTRQTIAGAGLGLTVARGLVEAHGGRIAVEPGPGGRVSFTVPTTS
jgi:signal transduction histidine kinase